MSIKVCKFGGTSMADGNIILTAAKIVNADADRRYVVVSAPGKRFSCDIKVTDLLYRLYDESVSGDLAAFEETYKKIRTRFLNVEKETGRSFGLEAELEKMKAEVLSGAGRDYCASRGEYFAAKIVAAVLDRPFVDATEFIRFDEHGAFDGDSTYKIAEKVFANNKTAVIPGFYGLGADGKIKTFSRGGGDISGSIVAHAVNADLYENWTDVSGFYACDPRIVQSPKCIKRLSYQELRELSYMGANVLHSESIFPVRSAGIPIRICNTFRPDDAGTYIVSNATALDDEVVTGIAGKKNFTVISLEKSMMNAEIGFARKVLAVIDKHGISFEHLPSGIDTMSLVIDNEFLKNGGLDVLIAEMKEAVSPDRIYTHENIALVATVGHGMANNVGTSARLFKALADAGINVIMIDQGSSELNIIVGVENDKCDDCIRAIYKEFFA